MRCQLRKPRPGRGPPEMPVFAPRLGRRQHPGPGRKNKQRGEEKVNARGTQRNAEQPPHARASSTKDHAAPNPRSRDRAAGQKDKPEPPGANATGSEEQPDCDTPHDCATHGEASEHIGIHTSSNANPDCAERNVQKPHGVTVFDDEPACDTHR